MDSLNLELGKFPVPKTIWLQFHCLDFVFGTLKVTAGDGKIIIGQKALAVFRKRFGKFG